MYSLTDVMDMNCPLCGTPLDDTELCPNCGEETTQKTALPGIYYDTLEESREEENVPVRKRREAFFTPGEKRAIAGCFLLLILFIGMIGWVSGQYDPDATAIAGKGISMKNSTFAVYYETAVQSLLSSSDTVLFDSTKPLHKQYYNIDVGYTWDDYFKDQAFSSAALTETLVYAANQDGFSLPEAQQAALEAEKTAMETSAKGSYGDPDRYLSANMGEHVTWEGYWDYREDAALAQAYADARFVSYSFSDQEISAYYDQNSASYSDLERSDIPNVNIRHILFVPETNSTEDDQAAKTEAEAILSRCLSAEAASREDVFLELVAEYSQDSGSSANGGLLENVSPGDLSNAISTWCFDPDGRQIGDLAVLPSNYGYHVVYFAGYRDNYTWKDQVLSDMRTQALGAEMSLLLQETDCHLTRFASR